MSQQIASPMLPSASSLETGHVAGSAIAAWAKRVWKGFEDAQQARADRLVTPYLARYSDEKLRSLGFSPERIAAIRREAGIRFVARL